VTEVEVEEVATGPRSRVACDYFFSTMPVKELVKQTTPAPPAEVREVANGLVYRDFLTVGLLLKKLHVQVKGSKPAATVEDNWIYVQDGGVQVGRIQVFNNWSPYMVADRKNTVWIGLEYFVNEGEKLWNMKDADLIELGTKELERIGFIKRDDVLDGCVLRMPKAYPPTSAPTTGSTSCATGRSASEPVPRRPERMHRYNNQDHSMLTAMMAVDNIAEGRTDHSNLWDVNLDMVYHEEKTEPRPSAMRFLVVVLLAALVARFERGRISSRLGGVQRALESRGAPLAFGLVFGAIVWWTWGQVHPYGLLHDELAYVLQAKLFASGQWTAPAPPMPEFFAQPHVLNDPVVASKYPPGHSLLWRSDSCSACRRSSSPRCRRCAARSPSPSRGRLTNGAIALGTGMLLLHGQSLYFGASFFSETTTGRDAARRVVRAAAAGATTGDVAGWRSSPSPSAGAHHAAVQRRAVRAADRLRRAARAAAHPPVARARRRASPSERACWPSCRSGARAPPATGACRRWPCTCATTCRSTGRTSATTPRRRGARRLPISRS
jgi:hypothetical protein